MKFFQRLAHKLDGWMRKVLVLFGIYLLRGEYEHGSDGLGSSKKGCVIYETQIAMKKKDVHMVTLY
jgi:hypothetical protein